MEAESSLWKYLYGSVAAALEISDIKLSPNSQNSKQ
jgi:hypothetical protein